MEKTIVCIIIWFYWSFLMVATQECVLKPEAIHKKAIIHVGRLVEEKPRFELERTHHTYVCNGSKLEIQIPYQARKANVAVSYFSGNKTFFKIKEDDILYQLDSWVGVTNFLISRGKIIPNITCSGTNVTTNEYINVTYRTIYSRSFREKYEFDDFFVYTLSEFPLVQYVVMEREGQAFALQLIKPYKANSQSKWLYADHKVYIEITSDIKRFDRAASLEAFLRDYGTSTMITFTTMMNQCKLLVLQAHSRPRGTTTNFEESRKLLESRDRYLLIMVGVILCYSVYLTFNVVANCRTLRRIKKRQRQQAAPSVFCSLSQSLTSQCIYRHHDMENEKVCIKLAVLEGAVRRIEQSVAVIGNNSSANQSSRPSTTHYDYIQVTDTSLILPSIPQNGNSTPANQSTLNGYLTPNKPQIYSNIPFFKFN